MAETQVKNTFIDVNLPSTATPVPSPPASAPARQAVALKDSLQQAAEDASAATTGTAAGTAPAGIARRAKPNPLNFLSQNSMASIPEDQANGTVKRDPMMFVSGMSEMPATPAYTWGVLQTPTGTPSGYRAYGSAPPMVATPTEVQRKTLSLQDMIQSPKVEDKAALLNNSYHQLYSVPPYPQAPMQPALHPMPHGAPLHTVPHTVAHTVPMAETATYAPMPQAGGPPEMYMPMQGHQPPIFSSIPVQHMPPQPMNGCPAVALGLVHGPRQPMAAMPQPMPQPMPQQAMPQAAPAVAQPMPMQPMQTLAAPMAQPVAQPLQAQFGLPSYAAPLAAPPGGVIAHPAHPHPQLPPPPPTFAAPSVVMSPKAQAVSTAPPVSESDIRTLLEVATTSGNPEAINAVMRQAQMAGMSPEKFRSLLPPNNSA